MARDSRGRFTAGVEISVIDSTLGPLRTISKGFSNLEKAGKKAALAFDISNLESLGRDAGGLIEKPLTKFKDFQKTMSEVRAKTFKGNMTAGAQAEFKELTDAARELGATTSFSASQAAGGMVNLSTAGFTAKEQLASMAGVLDLAKAGNESIANSAEIGANVLRGFGLQAEDMGRVGDVMVMSFTSSNTTLADLGETMKMVSTVAAQAGVSLEETAAAASVLGDVGIKGSMAGTTLRAMLLRLQAPEKKGKSALAFLGINTKDKAGNLKPFEVMLAEINAGLDRKFGKGKGGNRRAAIMKAIFGEEPAAGAAALVDAAGSGKLQRLAESNRAAGGTANRVALDMGDNAAGAAAELDSALEELQLTVGEVLTPSLVDLVNWTKGVAIELAAWAKENPGLVEGLGKVAGGLALVGLVVAPVLRAVAGLTTIYGGLTSALGVAGKVFGMFKLGFVGGMKAITAATLASPLFWVTALATGVALIYEYWEPISGFFSGVWEGITSGAKAAFDWILDKIRWVGEAIEDFTISVMTEDQAAAYAANKGKEFEANKKNSSLFADDLNTGLTSQGGIGDRSGDAAAAGWGMNFNAQGAANNADYAVGQLQAMGSAAVKQGRDQVDFSDVVVSMEQWAKAHQAAAQGQAAMPKPAQGKPLAAGAVWDPVSGGKSEMTITVKGDPTVVKTEVRARDPNFEVRMNAGGQ